MSQGEAFSRVKIDAQLKDVGWNLTDGRSVRYDYPLDDRTRADYVLCDRQGSSLAVLEAKRASINPVEAEAQAKRYAGALKVPYVFLANGEAVWFWEWEHEAHPRAVKTVFSQADLERRAAVRTLRRDPFDVPIDNRIVNRGYQHDCIDVLCRQIKQGRRKLLVEMATGTGKTRTIIALIQRLFDANVITRVLFLVDRNTLAIQAENAFNDHLPDQPCYRVPRTGQRFQDWKRITIVTLQTMINEYPNYSSGYFDLVITDECHRSIYGQWSGVLRHFDGIQIGLTATPCIVRDADRLPDPEDGAFVRDTLRFFEVDEPTFRYTLPEAIDEGYLVPYRIYKAKTVKTAAEEGFPVRRDELDWSAMDPATQEEFEELFSTSETITVDPSALDPRFTIPERNRAMVREYREVLDKGFTGRDGVRRAPQWGKTIVFAVTKRHAETLAQMLDQEFADKKPAAHVRYAEFVVSGLGPEDTVDAQTKIKRFKDDDYPQILVSVNMLDTGFDCPEVVNLVMARFTRSAILYQQMRGRGTRKADHIKKGGFTIFDFVGVSDFHGDDDEELFGGFVVVQRPTPPAPQPRRLLVLDVHDHIDPTTRDWVTLDEQGAPVMAAPDEALSAEYGVRFEAWLAGQDVSSDQERWLRMIEAQVKANAAELASFDAFRFTMPPFSLQGGVQRARALFGGEAGMQAMLGSLNGAVFSDNEGRAATRPERPLHH
jgi:type I restriction enzyme, R subunit